MRRVRCHECKKIYNYDVDDFCPRCGAFTQPRRDRRIGADGSVVRVEGINEQNHENSFVHEELHEENRERKGSPLEGTLKTAFGSVQKYARSMPVQSRTKNKQNPAPAEVIKWIVLAIVGINLLFGAIPLLLF